MIKNDTNSTILSSTIADTESVPDCNDGTDAEKFIAYVGRNYNEIMSKLKMLCSRNHQQFSDDTYHSVILKCHTAIEKKGTLQDSSPYGMESYLIRAYFNYEKDNKRLAAYAKKDNNYNSDNISAIHEKYTLENSTTTREKIMTDMLNDFSVLYIMLKVENNFDNEHFYLYRTKELTQGMTYKKLRQLTHLPSVRQKVITVREWVKNNVTKEEINNAFQKIYGDLL